MRRRIFTTKNLIILLAVLLFVVGFLGSRYRGLISERWERAREIVKKYMKAQEAELVPPEEPLEITLPETEEEKGEKEGEGEGEGEVQQVEGREYVEVAGKGEGITHLARRVLKEYLQENPSSFKLTPEHKIYIEDYMAKKKGGGWLELGEEVKFSKSLIEEALGEAEQLTPEQLENLTQYSRLVPSF